MMRTFTAVVALAAGLASAVPSVPHFQPRDGDHFSTGNATNGTAHKLIVSGPSQILAVDFNGTAFIPTKNNFTDYGKLASWMAFKEPNLLYAVDEYSAGTRLFGFDPRNGILSKELGVLEGSTGVVHLAFNKPKTRLIGSSYTNGSIDIWDSSAPDGSLELVSTVLLRGEHGPNPEGQTSLRAFQAVLDHSGDFFAINDFGGDRIHILDARNDAYGITNATIKLDPGAGPRHGAFISLKGDGKASHYVVVCQLTNELHLFSVSYGTSSGMDMKFMQKLSTYGAAFPPANATSAAAGELVVASNGAIYVSNRQSGNETDSISHFGLEKKAENDDTPILIFKKQVSSGGLKPRMMSLSKDESVMFVANTDGENGLVALAHDKKTSMLTEAPLAVMKNSVFSSQPAGKGFGPVFVQEL
ncbi:hypothetical protein PMZ80_005802 [Knufia obscura]|uniref:6-phosphogluconolactonase n=1 Tax=Knufia obscura TaxID=1635080 RepID=A0ABR0RML6_9EURO|nr:hypothetical protein PMZ80_005802 [Knufia obscura]